MLAAFLRIPLTLRLESVDTLGSVAMHSGAACEVLLLRAMADSAKPCLVKCMSLRDEWNPEQRLTLEETTR